LPLRDLEWVHGLSSPLFEVYGARRRKRYFDHLIPFVQVDGTALVQFNAELHPTCVKASDEE
jgi:hypothetical protein